jgi:hypothetical protein
MRGMPWSSATSAKLVLWAGFPIRPSPCPTSLSSPWTASASRQQAAATKARASARTLRTIPRVPELRKLAFALPKRACPRPCANRNSASSLTPSSSRIAWGVRNVLTAQLTAHKNHASVRGCNVSTRDPCRGRDGNRDEGQGNNSFLTHIGGRQCESGRNSPCLGDDSAASPHGQCSRRL